MQVHAVGHVIYKGSFASPAPAEPKSTAAAPRRSRDDGDSVEFSRGGPPAHARRRGHHHHHHRLHLRQQTSHAPRSEGGDDMGEARIDIKIKLFVSARSAPTGDDAAAADTAEPTTYFRASVKIKIKGDLSALLNPPTQQPVQEPVDETTDPVTDETQTPEPTAEAPSGIENARERVNGALDDTLARLDNLRAGLLAVREALNGLFDAISGLFAAFTGAPPADEAPVDEAPVDEAPAPAPADEATPPADETPTETPVTDEPPIESPTDPAADPVTDVAPVDEPAAADAPAPAPALSDIFAELRDRVEASMNQIAELLSSLIPSGNDESDQPAPALTGSLRLYVKLDFRSTIDIAA